MNEAETRAEYIAPNLKASGWGVVDDTKVLRKYKITAAKILGDVIKIRQIFIAFQKLLYAKKAVR